MVVVGGGLAGLVTARALATAGVDVTVCEAGSVLGGKLRLAEVAGHRVDVGAEAMLAVRPEGVDLLRDLGAADELVSPTATSASIWSRGALHPLPLATLMGVPTAQDGLSGLLTADEEVASWARLEALTGELSVLEPTPDASPKAPAGTSAIAG